MKKSELKKELAALDEAALQGRVVTLRHELFSYRMNSIAAHVKDYSQAKKLRKTIARALTYARQRTQSA